MSDLQNSKLRRLDLTVLLVFLGLLERRKATDVARDLGLTQSAVSHALKRLREVFGDELFLRRPHGMEPTAVALAIEGQIAAAVNGLRDSLGGARPFVPRKAEGVLRLAAFDAEQAALIPGLIERLSVQAPGLQVSVRSIGRRAAIDALVAAEIDLALGFFWDPGDQVAVVPLYNESFKVVGRPEVLRNTRTMPIKRYVALPHVLVSPGGDLRGVVDEVLERLGHKRRVVAAVPQFFPALATVAASDCIATLP